jgi:competence protein ComEC
MLVDGGPDDSVLACLGRHMPFWDREINLVLNTHPQKDHLAGLISILNRYKVDDVVRSNIADPSDTYAQFLDAIKTHHVPVHFETRGQHITIGSASLSFLWPSSSQVDLMRVAPTIDLNEGCLVFFLRYGSFDALFTGDADAPVEGYYTGDPLPPLRQGFAGQAVDHIQVLKVPHHGSKTGMTQAFVNWLKPELSVISVGKNTFGQPSPEMITMLQNVGSKVLRTDQKGDVEVVSDGKSWELR